MTRCGYLFWYWINYTDKHCVKGDLLLSTIALLHFIYLIKLQKSSLKLWNLEATPEMDSAAPKSPNSSRITHHFVTSGSKIDFCHVSGRPSWIYANNKNCPEWAQGQPSWNCSRTPQGIHFIKKKTSDIGKNISRSHNEFIKQSNRLICVLTKNNYVDRKPRNSCESAMLKRLI